MESGCFIVIFLIVAATAIYFVYDNSKYASPKKVDNSKPHNWVIVQHSGERWTTYSLAEPNVRRERGKPTYIYSLDEVHEERNLSGDRCRAVVRWKYNGKKIVKRGFSGVTEDYDGNIVNWGTTPAGINESFRRLAYTFWKDTEDGVTDRHFFTEEQVRQRGESLPVDIVHLEYHDLRKVKS